MENKTLEQRAKELKQRLSDLGGRVKEGKYWLTLRYDRLNVNKRQLYELEQERLQLDDIWNYSDVKVASNAIEIINLKEDIKSAKEQLKEEEKDQRELIYKIKNLNREYSKIERRLKKKQSKAIKEVSPIRPFDDNIKGDIDVNDWLDMMRGKPIKA